MLGLKTGSTVMVAAATLSTALTFLGTISPASALTLNGTASGDFDPPQPFNPFQPFSRFAGTFTLDSATPDQSPPINQGQYRLSSFDFSFFNLTNTVVGRLASTTAVGGANGSSVLGISNSDIPEDTLRLFINGPDSSSSVQIGLFSLQFGLPGNFFSSDALPTFPLSLSSGRGDVNGPQVGQTSRNATLTLGSATAVPTPALLPGLLGLGVAAFRKRKSETQAKV